MKRGTAPLFLIVLLVVASVFVSAVGSRTSNDPTTEDQTSLRVCANMEKLRDRVQCRFEQNEEGPSIPEACRNLGITEKERCRTFYSEARPCYSLDGREKDTCFRRVSGLGTAAISGEADKTAIRNYIVNLLYDLEERVEAKFDAGDLTAEQAGELIALITNIKEKILNNSPRSEIIPLLRDLRVKWNEAMQ